MACRAIPHLDRSWIDVWDEVWDEDPRMYVFCIFLYGQICQQFLRCKFKMILSLSNPFGLLDLQSGVAKVLFNALANACASSGQWRESLLVCSEARSGCHQIRALFQSETNLHTRLGSPIECRLPHEATRKLRIYVSAYCSCLAFVLSSQSNSQM